jgi:hypothetical protein
MVRLDMIMRLICLLNSLRWGGRSGIIPPPPIEFQQTNGAFFGAQSIMEPVYSLSISASGVVNTTQRLEGDSQNSATVGLICLGERNIITAKPS